MVTKNDVLKAREEREEAARKAAHERAEELRRWRILKEHEDFLSVDRIIEKDFEKLVLEADKKGYQSLQLHQNKVFYIRPEDQGRRSEWYGCDFQLNFEPRPDYGPSQALVSQLQQAEFDAKVVTEKVRNFEYVTTADGYDVVEAPGYHDEHHILVEW